MVSATVLLTSGAVLLTVVILYADTTVGLPVEGVQQLTDVATAHMKDLQADGGVDAFDLGVDDDNSFDAAAEKRKWGTNKARIWGKRKWGDTSGNQSRLWGKRRMTKEEAMEERMEESLEEALEEAMRLGSRESGDDDYKRNKWADNKARVWGKRAE